MKQQLKGTLKKLGLYYSLQGGYSNSLFILQRNKNRRHYKKFKGQGFVCNHCGFSYSRFVAVYPSDANSEAITKNKVINGYGENIYCPNCMCGARERLILAMLQQEIEIKGKKILHLSPETIVYEYIATKANVITGDIEPGFYKKTDPNILTLDATAFTVENDSFDIIIGNHMLEHIPEDQKAMKEFYRILKPGGIAILQVPYSETISGTLEEPFINDRARQSKLFGQNDHVRIYQLADYMERLKHAGFKVGVVPPEKLRKKFPSLVFQQGESFISIQK
ncbi:MAG TPA: methyltransferase domain-containing protein [Chitinophagaceae bacterium]|nr:methyltransferase domain-containing protein [Chitinophagaceae bacterium]